MKTLANCTPREFLAQTNKIRKAAKNWLDKTNILDIRMTAPELNIDMSVQEKQAAVRKQAQENLYKMLDAVMEDYPDETVDLLCLICFIDPKDADNHAMSEFLGVIGDILSDENVIGFFASLASLDQQHISAIARK